MKKKLLDLVLMLVMVLGGIMFFLGMLQFNEGFKDVIALKPFLFRFFLIFGLILMVGSWLMDRRIRRR
jgi:hypothetical protein